MPAVSADGRWIAFDSRATNLVSGDTNLARDVFLRDLASGTTTRVSVSSTGLEANNESQTPAVSADARYVAFASLASNLVLNDTNNAVDVFVRDTLAGTTLRVSVDSSGAQAFGVSVDPEISADGRFVVFTSSAANLVSGDGNGVDDVFLRDLVSGLTTRISVSSAGLEGNLRSGLAALSDDASRVAFSSLASNLVANDTNVAWDVFLHELATGQTTRISISSTGTQGNADSRYPSLSADGRFVAFASFAHNLVPGDFNNMSDVFVHDALTGQTTLESISALGVQGNDTSEFPALSDDGQTVAFMSAAANLVPGDFNDTADIFVRQRPSGQVALASVDSSGIQGDDLSFFPALPADGSAVAFMSLATNLDPGDTNGTWDAFLREFQGGGVVTYCTASTTSIPLCQAAIHATGTPSASNPTGFTVSSGPIPGKVFGLAYLGTNGAAALPLGTQGGFVCVAAPIFRAAAKQSSGTLGTCTGVIDYTLQELSAAHAPAGVPGTTVHTAIWFRDPPSPDTFALSDGLRFVVLP